MSQEKALEIAAGSRGSWCASTGYLGRKGMCRNPDGCTCSEIARLEAESRELRVKLETVRAETLEEAARAIERLDVGPEFDGVIVESIELLRSLKDKDQQNG